MGAFALCAIPVRAEEPQQNRAEKRPTVEAATNGTISKFVRALTRDGVHGGAIIPEDDWRRDS